MQHITEISRHQLGLSSLEDAISFSIGGLILCPKVTETL
jgi:hypothetical protein